MAPPPAQPPPLLSPGDQVGPWRVEAWHAQGAYGALYRAVRVGQEHAGPVALKLSVYPWDARFSREAQLLSRLSHPCIPQLLDQGVLRSPAGTEHPWFVMQWVDGTPLYAWVQQHAPSHLELCLLLAQLARALESLHARGAVHRDVKGDNVLVRLSDGRPFLIDFGSGHFEGAKRLTWQSLPPGTPAYLSPQASLFEIRLARQRNAYYAPSPADDLYALGVATYRLVMGRYPPDLEVHEDGQGGWRVACPDLRPLLDTSPQVQPLLRQWLLRLLSEAPEERGSAAELAHALETETARYIKTPSPAHAQGPESPPLLAPAVASAGKGPERSRPSKKLRAWRPWWVLAVAAGAALVLWSQPRPGADSLKTESENPTAAGDSFPASRPLYTQPSSQRQSVTQDPPSISGPEQPRQQTRPDAKGRCQGPQQVALNGLCWVELAPMTTEQCTTVGYMLLRGKCYGPALEPPQKTVPTSGAGDAR